MLPGRKSRPDHGAKCERHNCGKPAHCKVCTEADSFGEEYLHLCIEHTEEYDKQKEKRYNTPCLCEWCKNEQAIGVRPFRDPDEGCNGPIYDVCEKCRQEHIAKITRPHIGQHEAIRRLKEKQRKETEEETLSELDFEGDEDE